MVLLQSRKKLEKYIWVFFCVTCLNFPADTTSDLLEQTLHFYMGFLKYRNDTEPLSHS